MLPLHLQGWKRGSESLPSPLHILHVSASPIPSSPPGMFVAYCGSFMRSGAVRTSDDGGGTSAMVDVLSGICDNIFQKFAGNKSE
jgi:hypothetical protein